MRISEYLKLRLPEDTDPVKVSDLTENFEVLDTRLGEQQDIQIAYGSYIGNGKAGANNKSSLTFPFRPEFLFVAISSYSYRLIALNGLTSVSTAGPGGTNSSFAWITMQWSGNTVSWYSTESIDHQMNIDGQTYRYFAIGR